MNGNWKRFLGALGCIVLVVLIVLVGTYFRAGESAENRKLESRASSLQAVRKEYDFVIIDLPPVLSVADAAIVAPNLDGFVFVVRHNTTDVRAVQAALGQLKMADARIIGFLYNDAAGGEGSYYSHSYR